MTATYIHFCDVVEILTSTTSLTFKTVFMDRIVKGVLFYVRRVEPKLNLLELEDLTNEIIKSSMYIHYRLKQKEKEESSLEAREYLLKSLCEIKNENIG